MSVFTKALSSLLTVSKKILGHFWSQFKALDKFSTAGAIVCVFGSFYAFSFYVRMEDKKDFDQWKPRLWIKHMDSDSLHFEIRNQNEEPIWFVGFDNTTGVVDMTPRKYQALFKSSDSSDPRFIVTLRFKPNEKLASWWRDGNLNTYRVWIEYTGDHYKLLLPEAKRSENAQSLYGYATTVPGNPSEHTVWGGIRRVVAGWIRSTAGDEWYTLTAPVPVDSTLFPVK
jgi:hypothetical protein